MSKIIIYTTPTCPKCNKLKTFLTEHSIPFEVADMSTPESLTELRFNGVFTVTAPVLQVGDTFLEYGELFENGEIHESILEKIEKS